MGKGHLASIPPCSKSLSSRTVRKLTFQTEIMKLEKSLPDTLRKPTFQIWLSQPSPTSQEPSRRLCLTELVCSEPSFMSTAQQPMFRPSRAKTYTPDRNLECRKLSDLPLFANADFTNAVFWSAAESLIWYRFWTHLSGFRSMLDSRVAGSLIWYSFGMHLWSSPSI